MNATATITNTRHNVVEVKTGRTLDSFTTRPEADRYADRARNLRNYPYRTTTDPITVEEETVHEGLFDGKTASEWRAKGQAARDESAASWERCDTDGFLSQWANDEMARRYSYCARAAEANGTMEVPGIFDLDGNHIPARYIQTQYGWSWGIIDPANPNGRFTGWFNPSSAQKDETRRKNNAKKGYYVGTIRVVAELDHSTGRPEDTDQLVAIVDNGH